MAVWMMVGGDPKFVLSELHQLRLHGKLLGADGHFEYYEDDGVTERFQTRGESVTSQFTWDEAGQKLTIGALQGNYQGNPAQREIVVVVHGLNGAAQASLSRGTLSFSQWDAASKTLRLSVVPQSYHQETTLSLR